MEEVPQAACETVEAVDGVHLTQMAVGERMIDHRKGGSIISMGATNSVKGAPYHAHSGAGKAGVHNLMQTLENIHGVAVAAAVDAQFGTSYCARIDPRNLEEAR